MKKLFYLALFSLVLFIQCKSPRESILADAHLQLDTLKIDTTDADCHGQQEDCPKLHFSYPAFATKDDSVNAYLNAEVKRIIQSHFDSNTIDIQSYTQYFFQLYKQDKLSIHQYDDLPAHYYSNIDVLPFAKYKNYYTLVYSSDIFLGGAHPFGSQDYYVYDLATLKKVELRDLLNLEDEKLLKLGEQFFRQDMKIADSLSLADAGYFVLGENIEDEDSPEYGTFKFTNNFAITDKGIKFLYNYYEIAPYASGTQEFFISFDILKPFLKLKI